MDDGTAAPSVLDERAPAEPAAPSPPAASPLTAPAPIDAPLGAPPVAPVAPTPTATRAMPDATNEFAPISFAPLTLDPLPPDESAPSAPAPAPVVAPAPAPAVASAPAPVVEPTPAPAPTPAAPVEPTVRAVPAAPIVAALDDVAVLDDVAALDDVAVVDEAADAAGDVAPSATAPSGVTTTEVPAASSVELPVIVEATPVVVDPALGDPSVAPAPLASGPSLPQVQQPTRPQAPAVPEGYAGPAVTTVPSQQKQRRKSRRGPKLFLTLVVLAGMVAAGVVFGRPYLFPSGWDATTEPYAVAVETARGVEYAEAITVVTEPTPDYTLRLVGEFVPDWTADEEMWRSLGLLNGAASPNSVAGVMTGWQDALYSTQDGQVYQDAAATGPQGDAAIVAAMTAASLDQEFGWSTEQQSRTLDDQASTLAEVDRQARAVVAASPFAVDVDPVEPGPLAFVPPVAGYRALAPISYAEFGAPTQAAQNPLSSIGIGGPGPLTSEPLVAAPNPVMIGTDAQVSSPRPLDRSFWYLVFAGYLDSRTAYQASEAVVESSISMADRAGTSCVYATFAGGGVDETATLRSSLEAWSVAVPAEFGAGVTVLADGTLQLVSCDPGAGFENASRLGVARELVVWRSAELATIDAVNGTELDLATTWAFVEASNVALDLVALPADTSPADMAAAARSAVAAVVTPAG